MKKIFKLVLSLTLADALTLTATLVSSISAFSQTDKTEWIKSEYQFSDLNRDGKINIKDALILRKYIAGYSHDCRLYLDFNADGKINMKDYLIFRKNLVGFNYQPGFERYDSTDKTMSKYIRTENGIEYTIILNYNSEINGDYENKINAVANISVTAKSIIKNNIKIKIADSYIDPESREIKDAPIALGIISSSSHNKYFDYQSPRNRAIAKNGIDGIYEPDDSGLYTGWQNRYEKKQAANEYITLKNGESVSYSDKFNANMTAIENYLGRIFLLSVTLTYEVDGKTTDSTVYLPLISMSNANIAVK